MDMMCGKIVDIVEGCIWYTYKGDEITWDGSNYISLLSGGEFKTLEDMDKFWYDYFHS